MEKQKDSNQKSQKNKLGFGRVNGTELLFFTRHLALSIHSGLTLFDGLLMLQDQSVGMLRKVLGIVIQSIQTGQDFSTALSQFPQYFSPLYINLVKTGELSGTLENNLSYLAENLKKTRELKQKVKSALMYPMFIFCALIALGFGIGIFVLPKILPLFKTLNIDLPTSTRVLIFIGDMMANYGIYMAIGTATIIAGMAWLIRQNFVKPFTHRLLLSSPVLKNIVRNVNMEMLTHTLSTLLSSGIPLDHSLKITAEATENRVYKNMLGQAILEVEKGNTLASFFDKYPKYFPKMLKHMVAMGERTGSLDSTLKYLSEFYENEIDNTMKNLSTIIEPILLVFIGLVVGTMAMAILGPIYKISGGLN